MTKQRTKLYYRAAYWQQNHRQRDMIECALNYVHFDICEEIAVKLDKEHWCELVLVSRNKSWEQGNRIKESTNKHWQNDS